MKYNRLSPEEAERLVKRDRHRLIAMSVLAVLVAGAYLYTMTSSASGPEQRSDDIEPAATAVSDIAVPKFEDTALLERIADSTDAERAFLESDALPAAFDYARLLTPQALQALGIRELGSDAYQELLDSPATHRLDAVRVRGEVINAYPRPRSGGGRSDWVGTLRALDGRTFHFMAAMAPKQANGVNGIEMGDYLRLDGLFYKIFSAPVGSALIQEMAVGPLVLGARIDPSSAPMSEELARLAPGLEEVEDDTIGDTKGEDAYDEAFGQLMGRAQMMGDSVDWDSVPELETAILDEIHADGEPFRGKPFRVPVSINMDTFSRRVNDNPMRLDRTTTGWIGNNNWIGSVKTIKWVGPFTRQDMLREDFDDEHRYVTAKGYFFRNHVFTGGKGQPARSPIFVMHSVDVFVPEDDKTVAWFARGLFAGTIFLIAAIGLLLRADRKKSKALYEDMIRRKRERRDRSETAATA